jgi:asparagine synthase (glutamine-hydrolysing)
MCGILGIVTTQTRQSSGLRALIRGMGLWQYHRGPDGWGEWLGDGVALGQNRLAILDLVHGKQPMASADGLVQVVFNGEIYNFRDLWTDLSRRGYPFRTDHSDTEVIVHGYREWGTGLFDRLEGMFAIAIWDVSTQSLIIARDRLGIKPLYYMCNERGIIFASEPKTIIASGWVKPRLNDKTLFDFFMFRAPLGPETLFEGINKLSAGCWCRYDRSKGLGPQKRYWEPQAIRMPVRDAELIEDRVENALDDAALSHLAADVPVGLFLSGGVDSSLLAALVARHAQIEAFAVGTHSKLDESRFASKVANHLGLPLHIRWVTGEDFRNRFEAWSFFNDDPVSDPSALALMLLSEHARRGGMKVMLAGEGADELFGGYYSYLRFKAYSLLSRIPMPRYGHEFLGSQARGVDGDYLGSLTDLAFFGSAHVLHAHDRRSLFAGETATLVHEWKKNAFATRPLAAEDGRTAMLFDQVVRLPNDLLSRTDRATMAYSLEARVPYLDRSVAELANGLSDRECVRLIPPRAKWLLKRIAAKHVPPSVIYRRKRGFNLPVERWLAVDFSERIDRFLRERAISSLNYDYLGSVNWDHKRGRHRAALLWAWLVLEQWNRLWIEGDAVPQRPAIISDRKAYELLFDANERLAPNGINAETTMPHPA